MPKVGKPRKRNILSDDTYNARRREYRAAQRYLDRANSASGATADKYRAIAKNHFENALDTYDKNTNQKLSGPIRKLASEFGIDIEGQRSEYITREPLKSKDIVKKLTEKSEKSLESALDDADTRREEEARILMSDDNISSRILGGLIDKWYDKALVTVTDSQGVTRTKIDNSKIYPALFEYFGVDNLADMLERLEKSIGEMLFKNPSLEDMYETVKDTIALKAKDNSLLA